MRAFRRSTVLIVSILTLALALAACGGDDEDGEQDQSTSPIAAQGTTTSSVTPTAPSLLSTAAAATPTTSASDGDPIVTPQVPVAAPTEQSIDPAAEPEPADDAATEEVAEPEPASEPEPAEEEVSEPAEETAHEPEAQPIVVSSGSFVSIGYDGGGSAFAVQLPDGSHVIQFGEDFSVENGPALVIYLSTTTDLSDGGVLSSDYINLGPLQATEGFQEYLVPADIDPANWSSVIVWCEEFDVGFVGAMLTS